MPNYDWLAGLVITVEVLFLACILIMHWIKSRHLKRAWAAEDDNEET